MPLNLSIFRVSDLGLWTADTSDVAVPWPDAVILETLCLSIVVITEWLVDGKEKVSYYSGINGFHCFGGIR